MIVRTIHRDGQHGDHRAQAPAHAGAATASR